MSDDYGVDEDGYCSHCSCWPYGECCFCGEPPDPNEWFTEEECEE